jgi:hypothetical protein
MKVVMLRCTCLHYCNSTEATRNNIAFWTLLLFSTPINVVTIMLESLNIKGMNACNNDKSYYIYLCSKQER